MRYLFLREHWCIPKYCHPAPLRTACKSLWEDAKYIGLMLYSVVLMLRAACIQQPKPRKHASFSSWANQKKSKRFLYLRCGYCILIKCRCCSATFFCLAPLIFLNWMMLGRVAPTEPPSDHILLGSSVTSQDSSRLVWGIGKTGGVPRPDLPSHHCRRHTLVHHQVCSSCDWQQEINPQPIDRQFLSMVYTKWLWSILRRGQTKWEPSVSTTLLNTVTVTGC